MNILRAIGQNLFPLFHEEPRLARYVLPPEGLGGFTPRPA